MELDRNGLRILTPSECIAFLATGRVGRVALSKSALPTIQPVLYEMVGDTITFNASGGLLSEAAERGDIVCFEADFADSSETGLWSVVVVGKLELASSELGPDSDAPARFGTDRISLPMTIVSGRATRPDVESQIPVAVPVAASVAVRAV
ncbi:MAG: hypothetical protein JWM34_1494 [Ilumatobacteraceae bacterium]|nr:hypothetical protein [Ilumatobacteraceae bacterium]